jgi:hypothetical protein
MVFKERIRKHNEATEDHRQCQAGHQTTTEEGTRVTHKMFYKNQNDKPKKSTRILKKTIR